MRHEPHHAGAPVPWWYWLIAAGLLIWACAYAWLVLFSFVLADAGDWATLVEDGRILPEYVEYIAAIPHWIVAVTAVAAVTRLAGAIGLLLRQRWATAAYAVSLACVAVIMFRGFVLADVASVIRTSQIGVEALFFALSVFAVWYAAHNGKSGVLR